MCARGDANFDRDVADLILRATVGALLVDRDALADDRLLELVESKLRFRPPRLGFLGCLLAGALRRGGAILLEDRALDCLDRKSVV